MATTAVSGVPANSFGSAREQAARAVEEATESYRKGTASDLRRISSATSANLSAAFSNMALSPASANSPSGEGQQHRTSPSENTLTEHQLYQRPATYRTTSGGSSNTNGSSSAGSAAGPTWAAIGSGRTSSGTSPIARPVQGSTMNVVSPFMPPLPSTSLYGAESRATSGPATATSASGLAGAAAHVQSSRVPAADDAEEDRLGANNLGLHTARTYNPSFDGHWGALSPSSGITYGGDRSRLGSLNEQQYQPQGGPKAASRPSVPHKRNIPSQEAQRALNLGDTYERETRKAAAVNGVPAVQPPYKASTSSKQPETAFDNVQDVRSKDQRDLEEVDSGQRASATLWMGDLEGWMDETYIRRCISALGWNRDENGNQTVQTSVKMIKGASSTSGYCFITFPTSAHAQSVLGHFTKQPPMLMPGSERTFKLNWATGLPGVQPKWDGEWSVFVGDLGREASEGELVALFTPLFPSTKSAKIMYDPATGMSRGYGFVRFGDEKDMLRSLALGQNSSGSGLSLRGRTLRISEASGSGGSRNRTQSNNSNGGLSTASPDSITADGPAAREASFNHTNQRNLRDLHIQLPSGSGRNGHGPPPNGVAPAGGQFHERNSATDQHLLSPNATGFSIPLASPRSPTSLLQINPSSPSLQQSHGPARSGPSGHTSSLSPSADPNNTTVFVGGLPACISEDTLRSFFQHFGEITYVKVPPNKGCGFVQFVRRPDAELAIAKMHDFPIHGKSRIRLSWGRSQGDKQVEHVRKLANALNVPFEAVWRMVQGQNNSTIKQIATVVNSVPGSQHNIAGQPNGLGSSSRNAPPAAYPPRMPGNHSMHAPNNFENRPLQPSQHDYPDVETARAEIARLAGFGNDLAALRRSGLLESLASSADSASNLIPPGYNAAATAQPNGQEAYAFRPTVPQALTAEQFAWAGPPPRDSGPYSRVSPSSFAPMATSNLGGHSPMTVQLSSHPRHSAYDQSLPPSMTATNGSAYATYTPRDLPHPTQLGALSAAVAEVAGAPFDPSWHDTFGRKDDSTTIESALPPHLEHGAQPTMPNGMHDFLRDSPAPSL